MLVILYGIKNELPFESFSSNHWAHCSIFENVVLLMYTLEGVSSVVNFITAYEETQ